MRRGHRRAGGRHPTRPWPPCAPDIVALDASSLDPTARHLPGSGPRGPRWPRLLPGLCDVRRQLWRTVRLRDDARQNKEIAAPERVATLAPGTLVLADLGVFGSAWFDALTGRGSWWVSRLRARIPVAVHHVHARTDGGDTLDALVWLGRYRAGRAGQLVRLVQDRHGPQLHRSVTDRLDPARLHRAEVVAVDARWWDNAQAVTLVTRELGVHRILGRVGPGPDPDLRRAADCPDRAGAAAAGGDGGGGRRRRVGDAAGAGPAGAAA